MTNSNANSVYAKVVELHNAGKNKGQIHGFLMFEYNYSTNQSKDMIKNVYDKEGWSNSVTTSDYSDTVKYLRANYGKVDKKTLIQEMCNINGKKYSSNQHAYNYISMAIEWAKQEVSDIA